MSKKFLVKESRVRRIVFVAVVIIVAITLLWVAFLWPHNTTRTVTKQLPPVIKTVPAPIAGPITKVPNATTTTAKVVAAHADEAEAKAVAPHSPVQAPTSPANPVVVPATPKATTNTTQPHAAPNTTTTAPCDICISVPKVPDVFPIRIPPKL